MFKHMKVFILAGGFATRLWPLTEKRAKPLLPLAGKPLLTHLVEKIPKGIPITVSTNAIFEESFREWTKSAPRKIEILVEDSKKDDHKLGALGATAQWISREKIAEDVLLLTGDNYLGFSMESFLTTYTPGTPILAAFDIGSLEKASAFGTVIVAPPSSRVSVIAFEEKPAHPKTTLVSTGCSILPSSSLPLLVSFAKTHPDNVGGIFEELLRQGMTVECFTFTEPWFDIGSFPAYLEATRALVSDRVILGKDALLKKTDHEGFVVLGDRSRVSGSTLRDVVCFEDCVIEDCVLRDCVIDRGCLLRGVDLTGKMIREGTRLAASL